ncbi:MAG: histidine phosphatase family protein [Pseudomonadota bacterium]
MTVTIFGLTRHSETEWNRRRLIQGQLDSPLTAQGARRAEAWGKILAPLGWDRLASSDLGRAVSTARLVNGALGLPLESDPRFREQDWGDWTGKSWDELKTGFKEELDAMDAAVWAGGPPGGETREQVRARAEAALLDLGRAHPGERILLIIHKSVIKYLVYKLWREKAPGAPTPKLLSRGLHLLALDDSAGFILKQINALPLP